MVHKIYYKHMKKISFLITILYLISFTNFAKAESNESLKKYLEKKDIITRLVYPSLDSLKIFKSKGNFRNSNYFCSRGLWLPSSLNLSKSKISYISKCINDFFL